MTSKRGYQLLPSEEKDVENPGSPMAFPSSRRTSKKLLGLVALVLGLSNLCTWVVSQHFINHGTSCRWDARTPYAGLERNKPVAMGEHNPYTDYNETFRGEMWEAINIDDGMVALPDDLVAQKGLPVAQRFPWDATKGIYLINGHHNLHCVRAIYISLMEFWQGKPQTRLWSHVIHCVDALRQEVICNADDTPRYSTADENPESGVGQYRQCRSWDQLQAWVKQYNACYRYVNQTETMKELPNIERFIYCPEGSPYISQVKKFFPNVGT